ncbi:hypothetical protein [Niabella hibiscisoli]|uniref:hypothetical protein n=1 Tax=Niabella hibiscisoli TaxID=1825928 RepID=UPI001F1190CE|nr:hypothetical protein [Niabella hibiscisoli]MCH5719794.1 hypothetical protein [Niabella hibiscisoli]
MNMFFRYIYKQDIWNNALYDKVENISLGDVISYNQDKRALYDRWQQVGDQAEFKSISLTTTTPMSSRFVQTENTLSFESINVGYEITQKPWLNRAGLSALRFTAYTGEIFRFSTIRRERGIDYPYARSFSLGINANFK